MRFHAVAFSLLIALLPVTALSQDPVVDHRFAPSGSYTAICFPDDWQKSLVNHRGALLYDFGPGPYASPTQKISTEISIGVKGETLEVIRQRHIHPRAPIVVTELQGDDMQVKQEAFALIRNSDAEINTNKPDFRVTRKYGLTGAIAWASPEGEVDPAFRNVAWGTGRPIQYLIKVEKSAQKRVALGFCESRYDKPGIRVLDLIVEGAAQQTVDPAAKGKNQAQAYLFDAQDIDHDGRLSIDIRPNDSTRDPNAFVNAIWMFSADADISENALLSGQAATRAEVFVDCGQEPEVQARGVRVDGVLAQFNGKVVTPIIEITSKRDFVFDEKKSTLFWQNQPFLTSRPHAVSAHKSETGWILALPHGTSKVELIAIHGYGLPENIVEVPDLAKERERAMTWWVNEADLPNNRIEVPDPKIQGLLNASIRSLFQIREQVDGYRQFQPGPTVYRGLWAGDGAWQAEAVTMLGDTAAAREMIAAMQYNQQPNGRIQIMAPALLHRETAHYLWVLYRHARLTNDKIWLEQNWPSLSNAFEHLRGLRNRAKQDPDSLYYGLLPPGFTDGGVAGINPEYGSVYWSLIAMRAASDAARWLGKAEIAMDWQVDVDDFVAAFRKAAKRDMRRDQHDNLFLPMLMKFDASAHIPQRGHWGICHGVFLGHLFAPDDPLMRGSFAMLDANIVQGLVRGIGWLKDGVWPSIASHRGHAMLWLQDNEKAVELLYTYANYAAPTNGWIEEQMPQGEGNRTAGDMPHTNADAQFIRFLRHLLVLERNNTLELLHAVPEHWLAPSAQIRLTALPTYFGPLTLQVLISDDGKNARIRVESLDDAGKKAGGPLLHLAQFKRLGYVFPAGQTLPEAWQGKWGEAVDLKLQMRK